MWIVNLHALCTGIVVVKVDLITWCIGAPKKYRRVRKNLFPTVRGRSTHNLVRQRSTHDLFSYYQSTQKPFSTVRGRSIHNFVRQRSSTHALVPYYQIINPINSWSFFSIPIINPSFFLIPIMNPYALCTSIVENFDVITWCLRPKKKPWVPNSFSTVRGREINSYESEGDQLMIPVFATMITSGCRLVNSISTQQYVISSDKTPTQQTSNFDILYKKEIINKQH